jgi:hypothetical protein
MEQHMQTMPAHLQRQMGDGIHMSSKTRQAITNHMEKSMPSHLKQYAGAYMEQQIMNPGRAVTPAASSSRDPAPMPDRRRLDHSNVSAAQYEAKFHSELFSPDSQSPPPVQEQTPAPGQSVQPRPEQQPPEIPPTGPVGPDYGFIMEPPQSTKRNFSLPSLGGSSSRLVRIGVVLGGLLVLIIIFAIVKSLFSGGGNTQALTAVAQEQQAMIHILTNGAGQDSQQQAVLSASDQNFAATAKASLTSAQQQLIDYMSINHKKVSDKALAQKVDPMIDQQLTAAAGNSTYDSTFKQVMQTKLTNYEKALRVAYQQTSGPKGRKLLSEDFQGAQLLLAELNLPSN